LLVLVPAVVAAGCGGSAKQRSASAPPPPPAPATSPTPPPAQPPPSPPAGPGALTGEAGSVATGDIPDSQVFLVFQNGAAGYSMKYPEGWAQTGTGRAVTFRDKNNIVRILIASGTRPTTASVAAQLRNLTGAHVSAAPQSMTIGGAQAVKVVYTTESARNPVTGKRVTLTVDRYYLSHGGKEAIVDLGTPVGVDNVDAYRLMIESFRWR
jgi:hypothetical protein